MMDDVSGTAGALSRLERLFSQGVLALDEYLVAREALLGATDEVGEGRSLRLEAYRALEPAVGGPFILIDVLTKARLFKYDWARLALHLDSEELRARILGLPYESAPERWDELLEKLEHLARTRQEEYLSDDQVFTVKYGILGRLSWLELVGELVWLHRTEHGLEGWWREDGWYVSDEAVDDVVLWLMERTPHEASPVREERIHHYFDWIQDQCWRYWNRVIEDENASYQDRESLRRADGGVWSFGHG